MTDERFTTEHDDLEALLAGIELDDLDDLGTLLMVLLDRPVGVELSDEDEHDADADEAAGFEVVVSGDEFAVGTVFGFPLSVLELARASARSAADLGAYTMQDGSVTSAPDLVGLGDDDLVRALQLALGQVRLLGVIEDEA